MPRIHPRAYFGDGMVDASAAALPVTSSALLYGLSVYTVFPVSITSTGPAAFRLPEHWKRLTDSAAIIGIDAFPGEWTYERFVETTKQLTKENALSEDAFFRVSVHVSADVPGTRSRTLPVIVSMFAYEAVPIVPQHGARLKTSVWRRVPDYAIPSRAKVNGAYVNSVLGKQDALDSGYDDCIFLDAEGHVCELSAANLFIVRGGTLVMPGTESDILEGITRRTLIELAREEGMPIVERTIDLTELYIAEEAFACGTSTNVAPIAEIDKRTIPLGPITEKLNARYRNLLRGTDARSSEFLTYL